jgi:hypothetical protein
MNIKEIWYDRFMELLWEYHGDNWQDAKEDPNYPFQLAVAHFDWLDWETQTPERTTEEAFEYYLEGERE